MQLPLLRVKSVNSDKTDRIRDEIMNIAWDGGISQ
ncbi:hypothetical protein J2S03_002384 [Alicyclobacillus cycloheptanicus]|uniref:Uncharacterized protein n=1 Tax=Alicyclobacillus cycloheptanicus TaxID=1457 RepID=A0ABT9XKD5_9BACL|nr:hypothetical protein [Alicyclobacillus cycloheptanicus]